MSATQNLQPVSRQTIAAERWKRPFAQRVKQEIRRYIPRRIHLYGVGAPKTGTNSIAALFDGRYRSMHEPGAVPVLQRVLHDNTPPVSARFLKVRDIKYRLEVESNQILVYAINFLPKLFPRARFILTVRDPKSWVDSFFNQSLSRSCHPLYKLLRERRFGGCRYSKHDGPLNALGLYPLAGYLRYWAWHNRRILDAVPSNRLLVVSTDSIEKDASRLASFAGVDAASLSLNRAHSFQSAGRHNILNKLDAEYVEDEIDRCCGNVIRRLGATIKFQPASNP